ncbi:MAG TPA: acetylxylan esterase [Bryobacteraceae bacterium]|nr:acetylxylan esterase [Bryobacteraceae bacterium]
MYAHFKFRRFWLLGSVAGGAFCLMAQIPQEDSRNINVPNTDTHFTMPAYRSLAEWEAHKQKLRAQILFAAGLIPSPAKNALNPVIFGRIEHSDYTIEKVYLETLPGYYLGGNLYRPRGRSGKVPGVLAPHGHWDYGRLEHQPLISVPLRCINLAKQGYVAFSYDMVGYNDTIQTPHDFGGPREQLWGFGSLGLQLWNSIRALDFLESLPDVDPQRLAVTGESGGGTQTFLLAAVDDRVKYDAPVNMISGSMQGGGQCENAPGLRVGTFNVEIGAMMAPRPMLMVAATGDWTKNTPREEYPAVRSIYELYDYANNLEMVQIDAPHNYNQASREAMYSFFGKRILGEPKEVKEARGVHVEKLQDMLVWQGRPLPKNAVTFEQLEEQWIAAAKKQTDEAHDPAVLREQLRLALGTEWPEHVLSERAGDRIVLSRAGKGDRVSGIWIGGAVPPVVMIDPAGAEAARKTAGSSALLLTVFQTGDAVAPRDRSGPYFLTFNRSDDANRVQDIVTALAYLKQEGARDLRIVASGKAALWAEFAAAVASVPVVVEGKVEGFNGQDQDYIDQFFVPGIRRAGGLEAVRRILP